MIRIGTVPFVNATPLVEGIKDNLDFELIEAAPATIERLLIESQLDVALVPITTYFQNADKLQMLNSGAIASDNESRSVLFFQKDDSTPETIALDNRSRASVSLLKVLAAEYGWQPIWNESDPELDKMLSINDGALIIGDEAFQYRDDKRLSFDLVTRWKSLTGLPFVFAVWVARSDLNETYSVEKILSASSAVGLKNLDGIIARESNARNMDPEALKTYFTQNLTYTVTDEHKCAIELFRKKITELKLLVQV